MSESPVIKRRTLLSGAAAFVAGMFTSRAGSVVAHHDPSEGEPCDSPFCLEHENYTDGMTTSWRHDGTGTQLFMEAPNAELIRGTGLAVRWDVLDSYRINTQGPAPGSSSLTASANAVGSSVSAISSGSTGAVGISVAANNFVSSISAFASGSSGHSNVEIAPGNVSVGASQKVAIEVPLVEVTSVTPGQHTNVAIAPGNVSVGASQMVAIEVPLVEFASDTFRWIPTVGADPALHMERQPDGTGNITIVGDLSLLGNVVSVTSTAAFMQADTAQFTELSVDNFNIEGLSLDSLALNGSAGQTSLEVSQSDPDTPGFQQTGGQFVVDASSATVVARDPDDPAQLSQLTQDSTSLEIRFVDLTDPSNPRVVYRFNDDGASLGGDVSVDGTLQAARVDTDVLNAANLTLPDNVRVTNLSASTITIQSDDDSEPPAFTAETTAGNVALHYRDPVRQTFDEGLEQIVYGDFQLDLNGTFVTVVPELLWKVETWRSAAQDPDEPAQFSQIEQTPLSYELVIADPTDPSNPVIYRFDPTAAGFGSDMRVDGTLYAARVETDDLAVANFDLPASVSLDELLAYRIVIRLPEETNPAYVIATTGVALSLAHHQPVVETYDDGLDQDIDGYYDLDVDGDLSMSCGGDATYEYSGSVSCGYGSLTEAVSGNVELTCGGDYTQQIAGGLSQRCAGEMRLEAEQLAEWIAGNSCSVTAVDTNDSSHTATFAVTPGGASLDTDLSVDGSVHATHIHAQTATIESMTFDGSSQEHLEVGGTDPDRAAATVSHAVDGAPALVVASADGIGVHSYTWRVESPGPVLSTRVNADARHEYDGALSYVAGGSYAVSVRVTDSEGETGDVALSISSDGVAVNAPIIAVADTVAPSLTADNTGGGPAVVARGNGAYAPAVDARNTAGGPALYVPSGKICFPGHTVTALRNTESVTIEDPTIGPKTAIVATFLDDPKGATVTWVRVAPGVATVHLAKKLSADTPLRVILLDEVAAA